MAEAIPVELVRADSGWQLLRDGEPYFIRGAGGDHSLADLAAAGGNSIRTWDAEGIRGGMDTMDFLDEAHALGITVTLGIWLGHERHGFDYDDAKQVQAQFERARRFVELYKDHPALLIWGIGNEMEGFDDGDNPAIWQAVNDIAAMVKELDPNHPTMTVTTFVHGERVDYVHRKSDAIDIHGVNAYGGARVVAEWLRERDASKPFVLTEYGPVGPWESGKTEWGAPYEQTSTEKAAFYAESHRLGIEAHPGMALGGYAFLWGNKMEATPSWFGMWLDDGARLGIVDAMTEVWTGALPVDRSPVVEPLSVDGAASVGPGEIVKVRAVAADPEDGVLHARWELRRDSSDLNTGGDYRPYPLLLDNAIVDANASAATVRMPEDPGAYRLYYTAYDPAGNAATANVPLLVEGEVRARLPMAVYEDGFDGMPWSPSGWMGDTEYLSLDGNHTEKVHSGQYSIRMRYEGTFNWVGVAWQHPANNWGDSDGGFDLTGASALELWARGEYGGEKISVGVGLLDDSKPFSDSVIEQVEGIVLTREWQKIVVPLKKRDLTSIKTGFVVTLTGRRTPVTIYLDSIRYVR